MSIDSLARSIPGFCDLVGQLTATHTRQRLVGVEPASCAFFVAAIHHLARRPLLVVAQTQEQADELVDGVAGWLDEPVHRFSPREITPFEVMAQSHEYRGHRISALAALSGGQGPVVTSAAAMLTPVPHPDSLKAHLLPIRPGDEIDLDDLAERLVHMGYEHQPSAESPGSFSRRGGIVDVVPLQAPAGIRIELFGDRVDSLRHYEPETQRSVETIDHVMLEPASELVFASEAERQLVIDRVNEQLNARGEQRTGRFAAMLERLEGLDYTGLESLLPVLNPGGSILDYVTGETLVIVVAPDRVASAVRGAATDIRERLQAYLVEGAIVPGQARVASDEAIGQLLASRPGVDVFEPQVSPGRGSGAGIVVNTRQVPSFFGRWDMFVNEVRRWLGGGKTVLVASSTRERAYRLRSEFIAEDVIPVMSEGLPDPGVPGQVSIGVGRLTRGFELGDPRIVVVSDTEVFGQARRRPTRVVKSDQGQVIASFRELAPGDYVVHVNHGIGRYLGLRAMEVEGSLRDYLFIKYAGEDRLYVPTDQIHLVQKYVGSEGADPRLNRLGGAEWSRTRKRVQASVREMAGELIRLYASRRTLAGRPAGEDTPWQSEFEDSFMYEETADQLRAVEEIKQDLEAAAPMERLLCGDVGYGKTEVALRAAFKVLMAGRQVALLCPTTVLAHQHFRTCSERFANFPVQVEMLSRFRSAAEQRKIMNRVASGAVDVLVGTHRVLQPDVVFRDLGLIVVDEEHRFGVTHKERLKQLYPTVDVLMVTATPIPRTLHMSLTGLRDMSLMETPPANRYPIQTFVVAYDADLVSEVITRERDRGGQVFYVYNRVETMDVAHRRLAAAVPEARIATAHGQMRESDLERVMMQFLEGEFDVLLCTTIIESGLDIPNVNTLIVEDADRLGLAQLYQLRGRVGRSNRLAYAYLTYRRGRSLSETADKRLSAIREFTELGSGFRLALRDLEIRGAGNLLGPEQHGFMVAVGFDMYCRLLDEAVRELKGEPVRQESLGVNVELGIDAYLPGDYIPYAQQKIEVYQRLAVARTREQVDELQAELVDRFGPVPESADNLLQLSRIRAVAGQLGISAISMRGSVVRIQFHARAEIDPARIADWAMRSEYPVRISRRPSPAVRMTVKNRIGPADILNLLRQWLPGDGNNKPGRGNSTSAPRTPQAGFGRNE